MKKLTAIVLALMLIFACAGSALALAGHDGPEEAPAGITLTPTAKFVKGILGTDWYTDAGNVAYTAGQYVYIYIAVDQKNVVADAALATPATSVGANFKANGAMIVVTSTNISLQAGTIQIFFANGGYYKAAPTATMPGDYGIAGTPTAAKMTLKLDKAGTDNVVGYVFAGIVSGTGASVTYNVLVGAAALPAAAPATNNLYASGKAYGKVHKSGDVYTVSASANADAGVIAFSAGFEVGTNGVFKSLTITADASGGGDETYTVSQLANGKWQFVYGASPATVVTVDTAEYKALEKIMTNLFGALGFTNDLNGYLYASDFLAKTQFQVTGSTLQANTADSGTDPGDDDEEPPVTGDVAATFGFVMIAVAIVAAASLALVAKKAR